jgi:CheY-like chemotaxis protein
VIITDRPLGEQPCWSEPWMRFSARTGRPPRRRRVPGPREAALRGRRAGAAVTIRVLIADDQELVRAGFRKLLDAENTITVAGEAADGAQAVTLATELVPDVVLMDIRMPRLDGIEATRRITASTPVQVLILTTYDLDEYVFEALRAAPAGSC